MAVSHTEVSELISELVSKDRAAVHRNGISGISKDKALNIILRTTEMAQLVKVLVAKLDVLSLFPTTHMVEAENSSCRYPYTPVYQCTK